MYDGLRNLFVECVLADHDAYREIRDLKIAGLSGDLRLAMHTCSSMFHLADHTFEDFRRTGSTFSFQSLKAYQSHLVGLCPAFAIVRDCSNVHKHRHLTRHSPLVSSAESIEEIVVVTEYRDDMGKYRIAEKEIHIKLDDGTIEIMHECLDAVRHMWSDELHRLGVMSSPSLVPPKKVQPYPPLREHEGETALLDLRMKRGERFKLPMMHQRFNYETLKPEPIDLTDSKFEFRIDKLNHILELSTVNEGTGRSSTRSIELTEEQYQKWLELKSEGESQSFFKEIAQCAGISHEMMEEISQ
jgi:hypothetical protein